MTTIARTIVQGLVALAYPVLIYLALQIASPRWVALGALTLLAFRWGLSWKDVRGVAGALAPTAACIAAALLVSAAWNDALGLRLTPALVSLALLFSFGTSLRGESVVEKLARAQLGELDAEDRRYCRNVTRLWCGFFLGNAALIACLAAIASTEVWAAYSGFVAYLLIGTLFAAEYTYRQWRFRRYFGGPMDALFRRLFPPPSSSQSGRTAASSPERLDPEWSTERRSENRIERDLRVPADFACFPGHFPDWPVVPGAVQVGWAIRVLADALGAPPTLACVEALKFRHPVAPGARATLVVEGAPGDRSFRFELVDAEHVFSQGRLVLSPGTDRP